MNDEREGTNYQQAGIQIASSLQESSSLRKLSLTRVRFGSDRNEEAGSLKSEMFLIVPAHGIGRGLIRIWEVNQDLDYPRHAVGGTRHGEFSKVPSTSSVPFSHHRTGRGHRDFHGPFCGSLAGLHLH